MTMDLSSPCAWCADGQHARCRQATCGCLADHPDDDDLMRGFKIFKRELEPWREKDVKGGWS